MKVLSRFLKCRQGGRILVAALGFVISPAVCADVTERISSVSTQDIRQSIISFVNLTTMPGLEGTLLNISQPERTGELWRSSLGFQAEFTLRDTVANGYWGAALVAGSQDDRFTVPDDAGDPVAVVLRRDVQAVRGSLGLSLPITNEFKVRPYGSLVLSLVQANTRLAGNVVTNEFPDDALFESNTESVSGVLTLDTEYSRWIQDHKLELSGQINAIYTDTFSAGNDALTTWAWSEMVMAQARISGDTGWRWSGHQWQWSSYYSHSHYLDQSKDALGFRYVNELGVGLEWDMHIKPFDWFGWRYIGINAGYSFGDDVRGYNVGLSAR